MSFRRLEPKTRIVGLCLLGVLAAGVLGTRVFQALANSPQNVRSIRIHQKNVVERAVGPKYRANRILVRFRNGTPQEAIQGLHQTLNASVVRSFRTIRGLQVVQLSEGTPIAGALERYRRDPNILYAEPDYIVHAFSAPNDPQFSSQWGLQNTGQAGGMPGADIHITQAWALTTGSPNVVVGVIDTGVDYTHPDLAQNIWSTSSGFSATTQSGTVMQCPAGTHGFNFISETCDPMDDNGHGTHVSGTIGAIGNNGVGVAGINWQVQILPCKFLDSTGAGDIEGAIACIDLLNQLKESGVDIVATNNSWGGADTSQALHDAIAAAMNDGVLYVAAAGNDFSDNDVYPVYPASFYLPNVIAVAATDRNDALVTFSNFGRRTVHLAAPGRDILSTTPNDTYGYDSGTSMAAPHVTGVAALLKAQNANLDWRGIKNLILSGGDTLSSLTDTITQKRLDAYGAMTCTNSAVASRLLPAPDVVSGSVGSPITLAFLNITCGQPAGNVNVVVTPGNQNLTLVDDGTGEDLAASDGIYTGQWVPTEMGNYTLTFPDGSAARVEVLAAYGYSQAAYSYQTISGTNLNLGDDAVATINSPFAISFGGGSFSTLYVSSNGTISLTQPFDGYQTFPLPYGSYFGTELYPTTVIAPLWEDLYPLKGTDQNVFWDVTGTAPNRQLVIEWRNVLAYPCRSDAAAAVTFEVVFNEASSNVLFNYNNVVFGQTCSYLDYGQNAITGIASSPAQGAMWSNGSGPSLNDGLSVLWQTSPATGPANPVPVLTSISPSTIPLFSPDTVIAVTGSNFVPTSVVQWQNSNLAPLPPGIDLPTTYVSSTQLTAVLPSAFSAPYNRYGVGTAQSIQVSNPGPGGGLSNTVPVSIVGPGAPSISSLSPSSASAGDFSFYMDVKGNNLWDATIDWNGQGLFTTQISNTETYAAVPSSLLTASGTAEVTAVSNLPNGGTSNAVAFPVAQAVAPAAGPAQAPALQVGVEHQTAYSSGSAPAGVTIHRPVRFLGWNYGRQQGPAYLKYFSRPYGGPTILRQVSSRLIHASVSGSSPEISLSQPASLPGFAFHPTLPTGFLPTSVATGDFNRDGKMDWVVSDGGSNDLWMYFGSGDGTAQLPRIIRLTGEAPTQVVSADLRHVGIMDLVVAEADSQTIGVLLGNGDGTFQPEVTYYVQAPPLSLAVGDVNGDGKLDLVAGLLGDDTTGPLATLLGDGTGKFGAPVLTPATNPIGSYATTTIVLKDLNNDGLTDAVLIDEGQVVAGAHSYLSSGDGTFKQADYFLEGDGGVTVPTTVAVGDLDGDGCLDAVTGEALGVVRIFKGTCDGNFQGFPNVLTSGAGEAPVNVQLADMNGDGNLDVITGGGFFGVGAGFGEEASNLVTVLFGDGKGNLSPPKVYRAEPSLYGLGVADLNGDGKPEVIAASQDTDTVVVLKNDGQGDLDGPSGNYVGYITGGEGGAVNAPYSNFLVQDLNGDGKPDLAFIEAEQYYSTPWDLAVMLNDGTGHFGTPSRTAMADFGNPPTGYVLGDFRNAGVPDLVVSSSGYQGKSNADLIFVPNNGSGTFGHAQVTLLDPTQIPAVGLLAAGDFNGDGKLDLVGTVFSPASVAGKPSYELVAFLGNGDGTFRVGASAQLGVTAPPFMVFVGDYNRDGKLDVLVWTYDNIVGTTNHNVYEFLGDGDGTFAPPKMILPNFGFFGMADLNHDGYPDIVEFNQLEASPPVSLDMPSFTVYIGQPDGTFKQAQTYSAYSGLVYPGYGFSNVGPSQILTPMLADFNGDGNTDVGVVMMTPYPNARGYMQVLAGNGDGTFTPTYEVIPFDKFGLPTNGADVTGDGRADLLELDGWPSSFHVIPSVPGPTVQLSLASQPIIGANGTLIVNLSLIPSAATTVQLSANDPNIQIPSSITIPANTPSASLPFTISGAFDSSTVFSISAQLNGQTSTIYSYQTSQASAGFRLFTNLTKESAPPGGTTRDYAIGLVSIGGYSTSAQLSCQGLPAGATCQFGSNPLPISAGQSVGDSLAIQTSSSTPTGSYTVIVVASDGAVSDQMKLALTVADFTLSVAPPSATVLIGGTANFSLALGAVGNWTDPVTVGCTLTGTTTTGCSASGSYVPGTFPFNVSTFGFAPGDYTINVSGSADGVSHAANSAVLHVQGATAAVAPTSANISVGGSASFNVTLESLNGYSDQFTFSCPNVPAGVSCNFSPASGALSANGNLATALTVAVSSLPSAVVTTGRPNGSPQVPVTFLLSAGLILALAIMGALLTSVPARQRRPAARMVLSATMVILALLIASCGGGGSTSSSNPPPPPPPPPPPQTVTVSLTVQASSPSLTVSAGTLTIQVQ